MSSDATSKVPVDFQISDIEVIIESKVKLLDIYVDNRLITKLVKFVRKPFKNYMHQLESLNK